MCDGLAMHTGSYSIASSPVWVLAASWFSRSTNILIPEVMIDGMFADVLRRWTVLICVPDPVEGRATIYEPGARV